MPTITLPDNTTKQFDEAVTVMQVAESIGAGLAKATLAGMVDDKLVDYSYLIDRDANIRLITNKDPEGLEVIRHSTAHLLAHAVKELFPGVQVTIGPVIDDGFYYDFSYDGTFTPEDIIKIEAKMKALAKQSLPIVSKTVSREEAVEFFSGLGEDYKVQIIKDLPEDEIYTVYEQSNFVDLCRGPHVPHTGHLKAFKLTKLAGAYWRGDHNNEMLQRIYGTAWANKSDLALYLKRLEEAKKRDHRELAKKMDLFHFEQDAPGLVFWHPNGWAINVALREYIRKKLLKEGYQEINTPVLVNASLLESSGHKAKFDSGMFSFEEDGREFLLKPMSCPCHVQVFKQGIKSYRDLPVRFSEFGSCHRNEPSGTLHGLMRVRGLVQDDGHIFCSEDMMHGEVLQFIVQLQEVYKDFGMDDIIYRLSTRPTMRVGSDEVWDKAEKSLSDALNDAGVDWEELKGEGAFYGPKVEFSFRDCLGRVWQLGTIQADFCIPERLGATYIAEDGSKQTPVMLHRAILGSIERFIAILLEHTEGWVPVWLAPKQVVVMGVSEKHNQYVEKIANKLKKLGFRANSDLRNEKIGFKIREHIIARVPYQLIAGDKEVDEGTVTVRKNADEQSVTMPFDEFIKELQK